MDNIKELVTHFPTYVEYVWKNIGLPSPSKIQKDIATTLQEGNRRLLIEAFRGVGKTYLTGAYATWRLLRNPNEKVLIVSASGPHATSISTFIHKLLHELPVLEHLKPRSDQRNSVMAFDVNGCKITVQPSVKCLGINSQLQGNRASLLIADDIETSINSATETMRAKIIQQVNEFDSILQTDSSASIVGLGTPQTGDSIYKRFVDKGFLVRIWTSRVPEKPEIYEGRLAPYIENMIAYGAKVGDVTDTRFTHQDLLEREASVGRSYFKLQYQLDTSLSDANRFPLKQEDLIVMDIDRDKAPITLSYSSSRSHIVDLPNLGFTGDTLHLPQYINEVYSSYQFTVMSIDPSGRGQDEMGYAIIKYLNGRLFLVECNGLIGGYNEDNLFKLAYLAKEYDVNTMVIESNFGDGMFEQLIRPILGKIHPCSIEEVKHSKQKELRIIDTLEPILNQHKLVVDKGLLKRDITRALEEENRLVYSFIYQLTHISKARGSLRHDDRLDALAIACSFVTETMGVDSEQMANDYKQEQFDKKLEEWIGNQSNHNWFLKLVK